MKQTHETTPTSNLPDETSSGYGYRNCRLASPLCLWANFPHKTARRLQFCFGKPWTWNIIPAWQCQEKNLRSHLLRLPLYPKIHTHQQLQPPKRNKSGVSNSLPRKSNKSAQTNTKMIKPSLNRPENTTNRGKNKESAAFPAINCSGEQTLGQEKGEIDGRVK